jgi:hypothetical protein
MLLTEVQHMPGATVHKRTFADCFAEATSRHHDLSVAPISRFLLVVRLRPRPVRLRLHSAPPRLLASAIFEHALRKVGPSDSSHSSASVAPTLSEAAYSGPGRPLAPGTADLVCCMYPCRWARPKAVVRPQEHWSGSGVDRTRVRPCLSRRNAPTASER